MKFSLGLVNGLVMKGLTVCIILVCSVRKFIQFHVLFFRHFPQEIVTGI